MKTCLIEVEQFDQFDYGPTHPLKMYRLRLTYKLMEAYGLTSLPQSYIIRPKPAPQEEVLTFHTPQYLEALRLADSGIWFADAYRWGLGPGDNPITEGIYRCSLLKCGASLAAAEEIISGHSRISFNFAGGLHHAMPSKASGFCYLNDAVVAINKLVKHFSKVAYIDIDAHHGDGVQYAFYKTDKVLTISIHQSGYYLFPGTGFEDEIGEGQGKGYSVNIPLLPQAGDDVFIKAMDEVIIPLVSAYNPDVIVTQLGVDTFASDPLTTLEMSTEGFCYAIKAFKGLNKPWLALGGGGYDVGNVARGWTLAWAIMNDIDLPDEVPNSWGEEAKELSVYLPSLRDKSSRPSSKAVKEDLERVIEKLKGNVFYSF
jgi:acetoin utilization protein AcuC